MNTRLHHLIAATLLLGGLSWLAPVRAAESYDNCTGFIDALPAAITTPGTWCLRNDLATAMDNGRAIAVLANNVSIDCNHFRIGGLAAGPDTTAMGIVAENRSNVSVRQCNVRGFQRGIYLSGAGHVVEGNRLDGNTNEAITVNGDSGSVRRNIVVDTGGGTEDAGVSGIWATGGTDVLDNTVSGVAAVPFPALPNVNAFGIVAVNNRGASIRGNRVRDILPAGTGRAVGISLSNNSQRTSVSDNQISNPGTAGIGLACESGGQQITSGNHITGFVVALDGDCVNGGGNVGL